MTERTTSSEVHLVQDAARLRDLLAAGAARWRTRVRDHAADGDLGRVLHMFRHGLRKRVRTSPPVEATLFRHGRYLHRTRTGALPVYRLRPFSLPPGVDYVADRRFVVELEKVTTYCGFSYAPGGWHPFVALLEEYRRNPALRYEHSVLHRLYARLTPATAQEAIFDDVEESLAPLDRLPPLHHRVLRPLWRLDQREVDTLTRTSVLRPVRDDNARYLGPKSHAVGLSHFQRVIGVYDSIRRHGYHPARFGGGRPRGYFLVRDGDYRFVASGANHRLPALRMTGETHVVASSLENLPPVIDEEDLEQWTPERGGPFPRPVVRRLFDRMFTATGAERADHLGLR
jgi:hypothetical protein